MHAQYSRQKGWTMLTCPLCVRIDCVLLLSVHSPVSVLGYPFEVSCNVNELPFCSWAYLLAQLWVDGQWPNGVAVYYSE